MKAQLIVKAGEAVIKILQNRWLCRKKVLMHYILFSVKAFKRIEHLLCIILKTTVPLSSFLRMFVYFSFSFVSFLK